MNSIIKLAPACVVVAVATIAPAANAAFFTGLGDLPGEGEVFESHAWGISADGSFVVGDSYSASDSEAFRWTSDGGMVGLGDLPGGRFASFAESVSADGSVVVGRSSTDFHLFEAFRWTPEDGMVSLGDLAGKDSSSWAFDVSADGAVVVGDGFSEFGPEAFRWTAEEGMVGLGALPGGFTSRAFGVSADGAVVVGYAQTSSGQEAFRWTSEGGMVGLGDLPGGNFGSGAEDVSGDGSVVVGASRGQAFRWTIEGGMVGLGDLPGGDFGSIARSVSGDGSIVVGHGTTDVGAEAFIWDEANGIRKLVDVLVDEFALGDSLSGWRLFAAQDVSNDGKVVTGRGINPEGNEEAWIANLRTSLPGDTNSDGRVSLDDLNNVRNHFGAMGTDDGSLTGDTFPFDGLVNIDDLNAVLNNFDATSPAASVPEPAGFALASLAALVALSAPRRRPK